VNLNDLKVGQRVKVKGKPEEGNRFVALEVSQKVPKDQAEIEGVLQAIDAAHNSVRILNREFTLPGDLNIQDLQQQRIALGELKSGELVKLKGKYSPSTGLAAEKLKMKETMGFMVEELQGIIDKIDSTEKTLSVVGFTVVVNDKTIIEGF